MSCPNLPILDAPDPRRRLIPAPVKTIDDGLRTRIADMFERMYAAPGFGLAL